MCWNATVSKAKDDSPPPNRRYLPVCFYFHLSEDQAEEQMEVHFGFAFCHELVSNGS